ncbi:aspartate carbamoyltransferase catalytic subunit [Nitratifractor sp.]
MQHLVDTDQLSLEQIFAILEDARRFKEKLPPPLLRDRVLMTLFFEASTRTRSSFEVAAKRLGAHVVHLDPTRSSTKKGETLEDTFANLCAMDPDGVIIRHSENDTPSRLAEMELVPVINAGAGNYAHPTQALLDLFTLWEWFDGEVEGLRVAIVGDIVNSRVAASDIRLFRRFGIELSLVAPKPFMPITNLPQYEKIEEIIDEVDVIMSLRAQLERHKKPIFDDYEEYARHYCVTEDLLDDRSVMVMHPGPVMRNIDISDEILDDPRSLVLDQVRNGVYVRMAVLKLLLLDSREGTES